MKESNVTPLCVDLDDTLLKTDLLYETLLITVKRFPLAALSLPWWLLRGRAYLKRQLAERACMEVADLPYRSDLVEFLRYQKSRGRRLVLVSASDHLIAEKVAAHLHLFEEVVASSGSSNLKGRVKAKLLEERFGKQGFDYIGDSRSDFAVWRSARRAFVVTDSHRFANAIKTIVPVEKIFPRSAGRLASLIKAFRIHQWSKNLLVFVPAITSHKIFDRSILISGFLAFLSFSLFCSGVYLINDLLDLEADRRHVEKRFRALAAGELSIVSAVLWGVGLIAFGAVLGSFCGPSFLAILALYGVGNFAYSIWIKRVVMLDVVVLACFYSLRLLAGGAATGIGCSEWLLAFSVFFFFGLAMIKRYSELREFVGVESQREEGRGYFRTDLDPVASFGVSSGLISVLVLVLYVMSPEVRIIYHRPTILLLLCPLFLYWVTRIWFKALRGEVPEDPVVFALTDRTSYIAGFLAAIVLYAATI